MFDLDDTLHNASRHIFPHIGRSMMAYMCQHLEIDEAEATRLRKQYWLRYGATMLGLVRHHGVNPQHFLHHTHQFPNLASFVIAERGLAAMLRQLPGRKIIFSNAPKIYIESVLTIAGVGRCFDAVYSIERVRFQPKPAVGAFLRLLHDEALDPRACIMVEDTRSNLKTAKRLGMKTVWVNASTRRALGVDVKVPSVLHLPERLRQL